jgi:hypothetical protein
LNKIAPPLTVGDVVEHCLAIRWYTVRIRREGSSTWAFVSQNYKHPRYSKRNLANYIGDDVATRILRISW